MKDLVYDSGDDTKTLLEWAVTIAAFFPDLGPAVAVGLYDRRNGTHYKSGLDALLRLAKRKDKAGEWSCTLHEDRWEFARYERPGKRGSYLDWLVIR